MRPREIKNVRIDMRVAPGLKADLTKLWEQDPRTFGSLTAYITHLLGEIVSGRLAPEEVAQRQAGKQKAALGGDREAAKAAERKRESA